MNKFVLGAVTACLFTTDEGRKLVETASRVAVRGGDKLLKSKLGIDMKSLLDDNETEEPSDDAH